MSDIETTSGPSDQRGGGSSPRAAPARSRIRRRARLVATRFGAMGHGGAHRRALPFLVAAIAAFLAGWLSSGLLTWCMHLLALVLFVVWVRLVESPERDPNVLHLADGVGARATRSLGAARAARRSSPIARALLCTSGAGLGCLLLAPGPTSAYVAGNHVLGLDQRDVRVFNNFADAAANDNTTPHGNWPGSTGAALAIRKAAAEWGSRLYGNGSGDPSQPGDLGSGGANFDVSWQGAAPGVGGPTENVVSAATSLGGGVIAFTEAGAGGWRIRLSDAFLWDDGPGDPIPGALDIQAVVTHELGHALGLLDSPVPGATMASSFVGAGVAGRSLEPDDQAGIQFLYGAASPTKPRIDGLVGSGLFEIVGANFAPTGNEVWFTFAVMNSTGEPLKVTGLTSTAGGTRILVGAPAVSGSGDILVKVPGSGFDTLSNAFPYDETCAAPAVYCTAKTNSLGCASAILTSGAPSATTGSGFTIGATNLLNQQPGILIYSTTGAAATPFQGGFLCLQPPVVRTGAQSSGGSPPPAADCSGTFALDFNAWIASGADPALLPGTDVWAQYWSRDPGFAPPAGSNLTDAVTFVVCN